MIRDGKSGWQKSQFSIFVLQKFCARCEFFIEKLFFFFSYDFLSLDGGEGGTRARIFVHSHLKCTVGSRNKFPRVFFMRVILYWTNVSKAPQRTLRRLRWTWNTQPDASCHSLTKTPHLSAQHDNSNKFRNQGDNFLNGTPCQGSHLKSCDLCGIHCKTPRASSW